jgi:hypothetical protein
MTEEGQQLPIGKDREHTDKTGQSKGSGAGFREHHRSLAMAPLDLGPGEGFSDGASHHF